MYVLQIEGLSVKALVGQSCNFLENRVSSVVMVAVRAFRFLLAI